MVRITFFNQNDNCIGFEAKGHAGYDVEGKDIVCSAISVLVVNFINSIEILTEDGFDGKVEEDTGDVTFRFLDTNSISHDAKLLMDSLMLGIDGVRETYGKQYLKVKFKEV